jgi:zinc protease
VNSKKDMMFPECKVNSGRTKIFFVLFAFFSFLSFNVSAQETCLKTDWPSDHSLLRPDPALLRGRFDNGFRYVLMRHGEPKNRVALYLLVNAGSFNETDEQRGYAHFLEHMIFNGTKNFPSGHLVEYFQSIGMDFGGDTNAFTSFDRTIYTIVLPQGDTASLDKGMMVLADYADGAVLDEDEINNERGVILSEKRDRDSADYRTYVASSEYAFRGTLIPKRMIIGTEETLQKANHESLKSFYDRWYRPDNMVLVVVGDMDPAQASQSVKKYFAKFKPRTPEPKCPNLGLLGKKNLAPFYHYEPQLGKTEIALQSYWDMPRSEERRVGKECRRLCRSRWSPYH